MLSKYDDGIYKDLPNEDYHADCRLSKSGLVKLLDCPAKFHYDYLNPDKVEKPDTASLLMGRAIHTIVLEPHLFNQQFTSYEPEFNGATKQGKALKATNPDKHIFSANDFSKIMDINKAVRNNKVFQHFMDVNNEENRGLVECSLMYTLDDLPIGLKSRPDFFNDNIVIDLKTCTSATLREFEMSVFNYGYHMQAAMMQDALLQLTGKVYENFLFLCVEKTPPYVCTAILLDQRTITEGHHAYRSAVRKYIECCEKNNWPEYYDGIQSAGLPEWYFKQKQDMWG